MRGSVWFYFSWRRRALNLWTLQRSVFFFCFLFSFLASPPRFPPSLHSLELAEANHWLAWHPRNSSSATTTTSRWRQNKRARWFEWVERLLDHDEKVKCGVSKHGECDGLQADLIDLGVRVWSVGAAQSFGAAKPPNVWLGFRNNILLSS